MPLSHDFVTLASCDTDDLANWSTIGDGAISNNTENFKEGDAGINVYKPNTTTTVFGAEKSISSTDVRNKLLVIWLFFGSKTDLDKIKVAQVRLYDSNGNYAYFNIDKKLGWQALRRLAHRPDGTSGSVDYSAIVKIAIYFETNNASDTILEGSIVMDYWHLGTGITVSGYTWDTPCNIDDIVAFDEDNALGLFEKELSGRRYNYYGLKIKVENESFLAIYDRDLIFRTPFHDQFEAGSYSGIRVKNAYIEADSGVYYTYAISFESTTRIESVNSKWISRNGGIRLGVTDDSIIEDTFIHANGDIYFLSNTHPTVTDNMVISTRTFYISRPYIKFINMSVETLNLYDRAKLIGGSFGESIKFNKLNSYYPNYIIDVLNLPKDLSDYLVTGYNRYLYVQYSVKVRVVDHLGNPVANAKVTLYDKDDNVVFDLTTDENGEIPEQIVTVQYYDATTSPPTLTDYNPFRLRIEKNGVKQAEFKLEIYEPIRMTVPVVSVYNAYAWTNKVSYQLSENVFVFFRAYDWNNNFVSGLTVKAEITKPDGSTKVIDLTENTEEKRYEGVFTETDLVGIYDVKVTTNIYGNTVEAKSSFEVGVLEQKIENVYDLVILVRKLFGNRWKIENNELLIFDDDNQTVIRRFKLYDKEGKPTETNVYDRVPV